MNGKEHFHGFLISHARDSHAAIVQLYFGPFRA
jgi:hypothetical protein